MNSDGKLAMTSAGVGTVALKPKVPYEAAGAGAVSDDNSPCTFPGCFGSGHAYGCSLTHSLLKHCPMARALESSALAVAMNDSVDVDEKETDTASEQDKCEDDPPEDLTECTEGPGPVPRYRLTLKRRRVRSGAKAPPNKSRKRKGHAVSRYHGECAHCGKVLTSIQGMVDHMNSHQQLPGTQQPGSPGTHPPAPPLRKKLTFYGGQYICLDNTQTVKVEPIRFSQRGVTTIQSGGSATGAKNEVTSARRTLRKRKMKYNDQYVYNSKDSFRSIANMLKESQSQPPAPSQPLSSSHASTEEAQHSQAEPRFYGEEISEYRCCYCSHICLGYDLAEWHFLQLHDGKVSAKDQDAIVHKRYCEEYKRSKPTGKIKSKLEHIANLKNDKHNPERKKVSLVRMVAKYRKRLDQQKKDTYMKKTLLKKNNDLFSKKNATASTSKNRNTITKDVMHDAEGVAAPDMSQGGQVNEGSRTLTLHIAHVEGSDGSHLTDVDIHEISSEVVQVEQGPHIEREVHQWETDRDTQRYQVQLEGCMISPLEQCQAVGNSCRDDIDENVQLGNDYEEQGEHLQDLNEDRPNDLACTTLRSVPSAEQHEAEVSTLSGENIQPVYNHPVSEVTPTTAQPLVISPQTETEQESMDVATRKKQTLLSDMYNFLSLLSGGASSPSLPPTSATQSQPVHSVNTSSHCEPGMQPVPPPSHRSTRSPINITPICPPGPQPTLHPLSTYVSPINITPRDPPLVEQSCPISNLPQASPYKIVPELSIPPFNASGFSFINITSQNQSLLQQSCPISKLPQASSVDNIRLRSPVSLPSIPPSNPSGVSFINITPQAPPQPSCSLSNIPQVSSINIIPLCSPGQQPPTQAVISAGSVINVPPHNPFLKQPPYPISNWSQMLSVNNIPQCLPASVVNPVTKLQTISSATTVSPGTIIPNAGPPLAVSSSHSGIPTNSSTTICNASPTLPCQSVNVGLSQTPFQPICTPTNQIHPMSSPEKSTKSILSAVCPTLSKHATPKQAIRTPLPTPSVLQSLSSATPTTNNNMAEVTTTQLRKSSRINDSTYVHRLVHTPSQSNKTSEPAPWQTNETSEPEPSQTNETSEPAPSQTNETSEPAPSQNNKTSETAPAQSRMTSNEIPTCRINQNVTYTDSETTENTPLSLVNGTKSPVVIRSSAEHVIQQLSSGGINLDSEPVCHLTIPGQTQKVAVPAQTVLNLINGVSTGNLTPNVSKSSDIQLSANPLPLTEAFPASNLDTPNVSNYQPYYLIKWMDSSEKSVIISASQLLSLTTKGILKMPPREMSLQINKNAHPIEASTKIVSPKQFSSLPQLVSSEEQDKVGQEVFLVEIKAVNGPPCQVITSNKDPSNKDLVLAPESVENQQTPLSTENNEMSLLQKSNNPQQQISVDLAQTQLLPSNYQKQVQSSSASPTPQSNLSEQTASVSTDSGDTMKLTISIQNVPASAASRPGHGNLSKQGIIDMPKITACHEVQSSVKPKQRSKRLRKHTQICVCPICMLQRTTMSASDLVAKVDELICKTDVQEMKRLRKTSTSLPYVAHHSKAGSTPDPPPTVSKHSGPSVKSGDSADIDIDQNMRDCRRSRRIKKQGFKCSCDDCEAQPKTPSHASKTDPQVLSSHTVAGRVKDQILPSGKMVKDPKLSMKPVVILPDVTALLTCK